MARSLGVRAVLSRPPDAWVRRGRRDRAPPDRARALHRRGRSRCSRPSPTRRSSPSRTCGCSTSWRPGTRDLTEALEQQTATERDPARDLAARRPTSSRSSTRSCESAARAVRRRLAQRSSGSTASCCTSWPHHGIRPEARERRGDAFPTTARPRAASSGAGDPDARGRPRSRTSHADAESPIARRSRRCGLPHACWRCRCCATGTPIGAIVRRPRRGRAVPRAADRAPEDLRRPGGHRDRERAPVHGAGGAQQRAAGRARAADGDQRAAQGDRAVHASICSRSSRRWPRTRSRLCEAERASICALRRRGVCASWPPTTSLRRAAGVHSSAHPIAPGPRQRGGARRPRARHGPHPRRPGGPRVHLRGGAAWTPHPDACSRFRCCGRTSCSG